jgi:hypothetical protein
VCTILLFDGAFVLPVLGLKIFPGGEEYLESLYASPKFLIRERKVSLVAGDLPSRIFSARFSTSNE